MNPEFKPSVVPPPHDKPSHTVQLIVKFCLSLSCCYFAELYQVGKDDKLRIHESPANYEPTINAYFFLKHSQKEGLS